MWVVLPQTLCLCALCHLLNPTRQSWSYIPLHDFHHSHDALLNVPHHLLTETQETRLCMSGCFPSSFSRKAEYREIIQYSFVDLV